MSIIRPITIVGALLASLVVAQAQQGAGRGPSQDPQLEAKRTECRAKANEKGLRGPDKRAERQQFMQNCVHGGN